MKSAGGRLDFEEIKARVDLKTIIEQRQGPFNKSGKTLCAFHDDHNPSLGTTPDGRRYKCWSCGATGDVFDWFEGVEGLTKTQTVERLEGFGPVAGSRHAPKANGAARQSAKQPRRFKTWEAVIEDAGRGYAGHWTYPRADRSIGFRVVRINRPGTQKNGKQSKRFLPYHQDRGEWAEADPPGPLVLYRLPEILDAQTVYVVEGEKCAEAVARLGLDATTSAHGAGSAGKSDWSPLSNKHVVIIPDAGGENYLIGSERHPGVLGCLRALPTPPRSIRVLRLEGLATGEDIVEYLDRLPAEWNLDDRRQHIEGLAAKINPESPPQEPPSEPVQPVDRLPGGHRRLTDLGNAERLRDRHGNDLRFIHPWGKWIVWDGQRWAVDQVAEVKRRAKETVRSIYHEAAAASSDDDRKALAGWAKTSEEKRRVEAMTTLAANECPVLPEHLDRDSWLWNCPNGTLDLKTGQLRTHRREDLISKLCPTPYQPDAPCPAWRATLKTVFSGDESLITFWQRLCGYCLTGETSEQLLPILWGVGANGKSTLLGALQAVWGPDYAMQGAPELLMVKRRDSHPTELADLLGKRLVFTVETDEGRQLNEALIKSLTGGERIRARRMREDFWEYDPSHKIMLCTNHKPQVRGTDHAIWRRLRLIEFGVVIPEAEQDKRLPQRLAAEAPGILAWAVQGCLKWQKQGLVIPGAVADATAAYRGEQDVLGEFLAEHCVINRECQTKASALYERFQGWAKQAGEDVLSQRRFGSALRERGYQPKRNDGIWYQGIGLRQQSQETSADVPF